MSARPHAGPTHGPLWTAPGLRAERLCGPNPLWASNGAAFGPDGRLWIAQFLGGTVGALDLATGEIGTVLGPDGPLTGPDDLVFGDGGELFVVDLPAGLVWRRAPDGTTTVVADGITAPDGIAWHRGRLFVNELAPDGRLLEIDLDGGPHRVLATGLALGNAMAVGPDGLLHYPHLYSGEVWSVDPDGGTPQRVLSGLDRPVAVRFDPAGRLRVLSNGERGTLWTCAGRGAPAGIDTGVAGADNVAFTADGTAHVTGAFRGGVHAVDPDGAVREIVPEGLNGPFGIVATPDGVLVADYFTLVRAGHGADGADGATVLTHPVTEVRGGVRGIGRRGGDTVLTTDTGGVWRGRPGTWTRIADGLTAPTGVTGTDDGVLVADTGAGRVLHIADGGTVTERARGLGRPVDVAAGPGGEVHVTVTGGGQVLRLDDGHATVLAAGLHRPEGIAADGEALWCAEAGTGRLLRIDPATRTVTTAASGLAFDVRPPHVPADCRSGAARRPAPFAGVAADTGGVVVGLGGEGGLLRLRR